MPTPKSLELDDDAADLLAAGKNQTGVPQGKLVSKALRYYVPRVLSGELSLRETPREEIIVSQGGAR